MYRALLPFVLLVATAALATTVLAAPGVPTARWAFDEPSGTVSDDAVGSMDGVIAGATSVVAGAVGRAFHFDGSDRVTIPDAPAQRGAIVAIDLWLRGDPSAPPANGQVILDKGSMLCGGGGYAMVVDGRYVAVHYRDLRDSTGVQVVATNPATALASLWDGAWHHVELSITSAANGWGNVSIMVDGWWVARSPDGNTEGVDYADGGSEPLVIGAADNACGPGFVGDIDQVRLYDRIVLPEDRIQDEPIVQTILTIDTIAPAAVGVSSAIDVTLQPDQLRPGRIRVYVTAEDGVERAVGARDINFHWDLDPDGAYRVQMQGDYGGESDVRVRYEPTDPSSFRASQDIGHTNIAKKSSSTTIGLQQTYVANEPVRIGVVVHGDSIPVTGTTQLWEKTAGGMVLRGSGSGGGLDITLPGRPAGSYEFEGRYLGGPSYLPSTSALTTVTIEPALVTGEVVINGGDATTDDPIVTVDVPATGATALWISTDPNDIRRFETRPYTPQITTWLTAPWYGDDADGVRTIWIKWADVLGRWSEMKTDTIVLDRGVQAGTVSIEAGAAFATSANVDVDVPVSDSSSVDLVQLSNDGVSWTAQPYAPTVPWTLTPGNGLRTVHARWVDAEGRASAPRTDTVMLDSSAPTVSTPVIGFARGSAVRSTLPARVTWTGTDLGSGIARYELEQRLDWGAWTRVSSTWPTTTIDRAFGAGHKYAYRVRAIDRAGHASAWATSATRRFVAFQESSTAIRYGGTWSTSTSGSYWGGKARATTVAGRTATLRRTSYGFAWVAPVGPTRGKAKIYINGVYTATVDLYAPVAGASRVVYERRWTTSSTRSITVRSVGTAGHPRIDVDGFISLN